MEKNGKKWKKETHPDVALFWKCIYIYLLLLNIYAHHRWLNNKGKEKRRSKKINRWCATVEYNNIVYIMCANNAYGTHTQTKQSSYIQHNVENNRMQKKMAPSATFIAYKHISFLFYLGWFGLASYFGLIFIFIIYVCLAIVIFLPLTMPPSISQRNSRIVRLRV